MCIRYRLRLCAGPVSGFAVMGSVSRANEKRRRSITIRNNLVVTTFIILFFLSIIFAYYLMLYSETRDNIIKNGELHAVRSANEIEKFLSTGTNMILLTGYTLDDMISAGRSNEQIQEYMKSQNYAASNIVDDQVNGIYGYVNGEFLNGIGWTPYKGYDPTNRPWYKKAIQKNGEIAVVNPYHDARTGSIMITTSKMLCDGKSVVAIDASIDELQTITENISKEGNTDVEIVLDSTNRVIAHSDESEIGIFYTEKSNTLGSALVRNIHNIEQGKNYFTMEYRKKHFIVYVMGLDNGWTCISVTNTTSAYDRLRMPLILTVVVAVLVIAVLLFIMIRSYRKEALAEKMSRIASEQNEMAHIDSMTGLKNRRAYSEMLNQLSQSLPPGCKVVVFDLNGLKETNDTYGHEVGDRLITGAAECIRSAFEGEENIFRIGGDEFTLITTMSDEEVQACLGKLSESSKTFKSEHIDGISISSGIGTDREHAHIENIVREADKNMYIQKQNYYNMAEHDRRRVPR